MFVTLYSYRMHKFINRSEIVREEVVKVVTQCLKNSDYQEALFFSSWSCKATLARLVRILAVHINILEQVTGF